MDEAEAIEYLSKDGNLKVPCSRYGWDTVSCAPYAWRVAEIIAESNGDEVDEDALEYTMGLVVNDHDDVASLLANHGNEEEQSMFKAFRDE